LLAQEVAREFGDRVRFRVEDFGASTLADRFGIDKYPAIFVDDALIARPEDFYAWGGPAKGKYLPWSDVTNREKFKKDLRNMIEIRLAGGTVESTKTVRAKESPSRPLPALRFTDLRGGTFAFADLPRRPSLVEFWAPWCPPCLETLGWMKKLDPEKVNIVAIAVESERPAVEKLASGLPGRVVMGTPEMLQAFGGVQAVPTLMLADSKGRIVSVFYGAPPDLHAQVDRELKKLR
jgi:thiol-disulfide isomerase/thioredoxin